MKKISILLLLFILLFSNQIAYSDVIKEIKILGNERIPDETILMFTKLKKNDQLNDTKANSIIKDLYETNFFDDISVTFENNILTILVKEQPIINDINLEGVNAKKFEEAIRSQFILKPRNSYNRFLLSQEEQRIKSTLKKFGYYFSEVETYIENLENNMVNINYKVELGNKAKIKKISFIGDKIYKDKKLRNIIISEEFKFWKFISTKKYLNEDIIGIDMRLLKNFYLNKGYYNVKINSSFAKLINNDEFELIYNITPNNKVFFDNLNIVFPNDIDETNYIELKNYLNELKGKPYSIIIVEKILEKIEMITLNEQYKSINTSLDELIVDDKLKIDFIIDESEKFFVERINIFGNNITRENVIRNQLEIDEGDPYNEILAKKTENNLKSLNFFKDVKTEVMEGKDPQSKIININVKEKATGEVSAGAGIGTSGGTVVFGIKENNYLGKGLAVEMETTVTAESFKGLLSVNNPNYLNSDKSLYGTIQAQEIDQLSNYGYKTNKTGFEVGTRFEYLEDLNIGLSTSSFYENIETDSTASTRQKSQAGDYWDTFIKFDFTQDKRNQKFRTTEGYISNYGVNVPIISDTNTLTNSYFYKIFGELYENNVSSLSIFFQTANSISGDDVKLSERLSLPSRRLRGFERGKVGPKDGDDFIGGNYITSLNINSSLPQIFPNLQNIDISIFLDAANIWGVDYDSSLGDNSKIRSSIGIGVDWFTPVGPLNFSISEVLSKSDTDVEESFRFNLGTTF